MAPPPGTAIVRPLRHVRAVRDRYLQRFTDPSQIAASRAARAWAWTLGETATAPVTDREAAIPPSRSEIETEIAAADQRRLRGDRDNRADAAATILRWLIGGDDHVPVRGKDPGELVGGFGDVVRSLEQVANVLAIAIEGQRQAAEESWDTSITPADRQSAGRDASYLGGVIAILEWVLSRRAGRHITSQRHSELTARELKAERLHADDLMEQARESRSADRLPQDSYGEGVTATINWLLGDCIKPPGR
jgi:hypothetical protein